MLVYRKGSVRILSIIDSNLQASLKLLMRTFGKYFGNVLAHILCQKEWPKPQTVLGYVEISVASAFSLRSTFDE